jgi:hypothetical protein
MFRGLLVRSRSSVRSVRCERRASPGWSTKVVFSPRDRCQRPIQGLPYPPVLLMAGTGGFLIGATALRSRLDRACRRART